MKNLIANFLMVVTLLTGSAIFASAQKPTSMETDSAIGAEVANSSARLFTVSANTTRYHNYQLYAGECVRVVLNGDGDTDLDLYVYDSAGRLIESSTGYSDYETLDITAYADTTMTVKVVNRGSYINQYDLSGLFGLVGCGS